jgi:D-alanyl-D-alanine carboxypeptidase
MKHLAFAALAASAMLALGAPSRATATDAVVAQPPAETPASQQARRMLRALTTGDEANFLAFIREAYPTSTMSPAEWLELRGHLSKFKVHGVTASTATEADMSVFDAARDGWARVVVTVEPQAPHAITAFAVRMGRRPADVPPPPRLQPRQLVAAAQARIGDEVAADRFSGAVSIAAPGRVLLQAAYGMADRETGKRNTVDTRFRIGSMGKMFTSVAIMQLAQDGKLDLSAPIGRYIKDYPNPVVAAQVTADQLMTHSAGVGDFFGPEFDTHHDALREPKDYVALFGPRAPLFAPGSRQDYSNYGFIVLGRLVEAVSGLTYDEYLRRHIFAPAHMTGALPETVKVPSRAVGYTDDHGQLRPAVKNQVYRGTPAGGSYSTVGDLQRFAAALMANRLLDAEHTRLLTTGHATLSSGASFAYDFSSSTSEGRQVFGHGGAAPGQNGVLQIFPDDGYTVVVLANRDPSIAGMIAGFIGDRTP